MRDDSRRRATSVSSSCKSPCLSAIGTTPCLSAASLRGPAGWAEGLAGREPEDPRKGELVHLIWWRASGGRALGVVEGAVARRRLPPVFARVLIRHAPEQGRVFDPFRSAFDHEVESVGGDGDGDLPAGGEMTRVQGRPPGDEWWARVSPPPRERPELRE